LTLKSRRSASSSTLPKTLSRSSMPDSAYAALPSGGCSSSLSGSKSAL